MNQWKSLSAHIFSSFFLQQTFHCITKLFQIFSFCMGFIDILLEEFTKHIKRQMFDSIKKSVSRKGNIHFEKNYNFNLIKNSSNFLIHYFNKKNYFNKNIFSISSKRNLIENLVKRLWTLNFVDCFLKNWTSYFLSFFFSLMSATFLNPIKSPFYIFSVKIFRSSLGWNM